MISLNTHLESLEKEQLNDLASFIVSENYNHHTDGVMPASYPLEVAEIYEEELRLYHEAHIFVSRDYLGNIVGSIRVARWDYMQELPIERIFGISPLELLDHNERIPIWHIGRLAIKSGHQGLELFKKLLVNIFQPIFTDRESIAIAECDNKLLRILRLLGIDACSLADPVLYLGSDTIPISLNYEASVGFFEKHKHLLINLDDNV